VDGHAPRASEEVHGFVAHAAGVQELGLSLRAMKQLFLRLKRPPLGDNMPWAWVLQGLFQGMVGARFGTVAETNNSGPRKPTDRGLIHDLDLWRLRPHLHEGRKGVGFVKAIASILDAKNYRVEFVLTTRFRTSIDPKKADNGNPSNHGVHDRVLPGREAQVE